MTTLQQKQQDIIAKLSKCGHIGTQLSYLDNIALMRRLHPAISCDIGVYTVDVWGSFVGKEENVLERWSAS